MYKVIEKKTIYVIIVLGENMKTRGFTLVELLAVIVILGLIALVSVPAITGLLKSGKEDLANSQKETIELAAKNWASDIANVGKLPSTDGSSICVNLSTLQQQGYVDLDLKNPKTGKVYTAGHVDIKREGKRLIYSVDLTSDGYSCKE